MNSVPLLTVLALGSSQVVQTGNDLLSIEREVFQQLRPLASKVVNDRQDPESATIIQHIGQKIID